jgi:hypothetical protein
MYRRNGPYPVIVLVGAALVGCARSETPAPTPPPATTPATAPAGGVKVTDIAIGRSLNADKTIADKTDTFKPSDTIYVSVKAEGSSPGATLQTRWSYQDKVVEETTEKIVATGPVVSEFHLSRPDGWPAGSYKIEVLLDGVSAGTRTFEVKPAA